MLVYSDDDRIEKRFDALHRQALEQQIIVFSCRQRALLRVWQNDQPIIGERSLQRLRFIPWRRQPGLDFVLIGQDDRHGLLVYRRDDGIGSVVRNA